MESNTFFQHNRTGKNRVTVCGVFVKERRILVISGVSVPAKSFRRHIGRDAALVRTSVRPMVTVPCKSINEAQDLFYERSTILIDALAAVPDLWKLYPKYYRYAETAHVAESAELVAEELGTPVVKSLLNQKLQTA